MKISVHHLVFSATLLAGCATPLGKLPVVDTASPADEDEGPQPGDDCADGNVYDCEMDCWETAARLYLGDGTCDEGQRGPNFSCEEMDLDDGDCMPGSDDTDASDTTGGEDDAGGSTTGGGTTDDGGATGGGAGGVRRERRRHGGAARLVFLRQKGRRHANNSLQ